MNVVVLGARGQIGSIIFNSFCDGAVIGTTRRSMPGYLRFDPFSDDWSRLGKADVLVNCIGQIDATPAASFYRMHVELTQLILKNRDTIGNPRIIQISALGASDDHAIEFLRTKGIADHLLLTHGDTYVVRPSIVCTSGTMILKKLMVLERMSRFTAGCLFVPKGFAGTRIQPVMPEDVAWVVKFLCKPGHHQRVINVVGPERFAFRQLLGMMFEARHRSVRCVEVPRRVMDVVVRQVIALKPALINKQQYALLFEDNVADVSDTERFLGRAMAPTRDFFPEAFSHAGD